MTAFSLWYLWLILQIFQNPILKWFWIGERQKNEATTLPKGVERHSQNALVQERKVFWSALFTRMIHSLRPSLVSYLLKTIASYPGKWANGIAKSIEMIRYIHYRPISRILHSQILPCRRIRDDRNVFLFRSCLSWQCNAWTAWQRK